MTDTASGAPTFAGPHRPLSLRFANAWGRALRAVGMRSPRLDVASLARASGIDGTRLDADDDAAFVDRLQTLLDDANGPANLNYVGRWIVRERLANVIGNRMRARQWLREHPATHDVKISRPLFVVGQPRTGTTLLYLLLAQDPQARAPRLWEINAPVPPPLPDAGRDDPRYARCERELARLHKYLPGLAIAHDVRAGEPDECYPLLETSGLSPTFFLYLDIPSYWERLLSSPAAEVREAYGLYRAQLQILMMRAQGRRWVSKSPAHLCFLDALGDTFPDAGIVMTHREPAESIPSLCSLAAIIRSVGSDAVDPAHMGKVTLDWFTRSAARADAARDRMPPGRVQDVHYARLVADPVAVVRELYERFDLPYTALFERRMRDWLAAHPQHHKGVHRYSLEQFGLDRATVDRAAADYRRRYFSE